MSDWGKHQIVDINIQGLSLAKNSVVYTEFPMYSKFISLILKLEVTKDLIHYVLSFKCEETYFMKITYLNFKSEHKFSQFLHRFKIGIFSVLVLGLYFQVLPN